MVSTDPRVLNDEKHLERGLELLEQSERAYRIHDHNGAATFATMANAHLTVAQILQRHNLSQRNL